MPRLAWDSEVSIPHLAHLTCFEKGNTDSHLCLASPLGDAFRSLKLDYLSNIRELYLKLSFSWIKNQVGNVYFKPRHVA